MAIRIAIDIGSNFITIYNKGIGVVLKEPSIAVVSRVKRKMFLQAAGNNALKMLSRLDSKYNVVYPINKGAISNMEAATLMLEDYIKRVVSSTLLKHKVEAIACISCGLTIAERRDVETMLTKAGCSHVTLVESPLTIFQQGKIDRSLIMILGGDVTEVAIVSDEGIITGCSVDIAGEAFNRAISEYVALRYRLQIGDHISEKIKIAVGSMYDNDMSTIEITGKDLVEDMPKTIEITASDVRKAISPLLDKLIEVIDSVMCSCPDNMLEEVYNNGMQIAGGSAQLNGIGEWLAKRCKMKCNVLDDPINSVVTGAGSLLVDDNSLNRLLSVNNN